MASPTRLESFPGVLEGFSDGGETFSSVLEGFSTWLETFSSVLEGFSDLARELLERA